MQSFLLFTLILLSIGGYTLGRKRALAVAGGQIRNLHSLPSFYGSYTALWCGLPALIVFALWATLQPGIIIDLVVAGLPPELRDLPPDRLNLVVNDLKNLVSGNIVSSTPDPAMLEAANRYRNLQVIGNASLWVVVMTLAIAGVAYAWRYNVPEMVYPEALIPGMREVGARSTLNLWGNVYPRGGFLHQTDDHKAGAVVAQRAGDVVTRRGQIHVYQPLLANSRDGYWPAGALMEGDASTGKWQELTPVLSSSCTVFPRNGFLTQAQQGDYAWALWRPYACCERRGQVFLGSVDFY